MKTQVYVDESKSRDYVVAAAVVVPGDVASLRRSLRNLLPRGQRRLHMVNEKPPLRRKILSALNDERVAVDLYVAGEPYATNIDRRRACLERLVEDVASHCIALTLESDRTQDRRDQRDLIEITRRVGCRDLRYDHRTPYEEPLLWIPDAVGWAYARGGEWRQCVQPVINKIVDV